MQVDIRFAAPREVSQLQAIERAADTRFAEAGHPELADGDTIPTSVAEAAIADKRIVVAVAEGDIAGWIYTSRIAGELCIGQICVHPRFGGRGIGTSLLSYIIEGAAGEASIVLNTQSDVPWNRPWYEKHGFVVVPEPGWSDALREVTKKQIDAGLDWSQRCHMRLVLSGS